MIDYLFWENVLFSLVATVFLLIVDRAWKDLKPFELPLPQPKWFNYWFVPVQIFGLFLPLVALVWWGFVWGYQSVIVALLPYLIILVLQIASEVYTLRKKSSVVWVMVPYVYLPYRFWQLYEALNFLPSNPQLIWVRYLLMINLIVWIANYLLDISQLPRLFRWPSSSV
ncbi:hypothetical protein [Gloeothece verrucosa]|uniref:Uncharacterized protein n=1 Tax=Gloeothece verrucosa (strain PCC 7822) TaxID=497965 RepID=E0U9E9_GLOV7|nr:hypothetical protein [Gloeothece verrucosa]ADN12641.1 conserved hypothetical protein [Gloeothece verrucosa PCC 7822]